MSENQTQSKLSRDKWPWAIVWLALVVGALSMYSTHTNLVAIKQQLVVVERQVSDSSTRDAMIAQVLRLEQQIGVLTKLISESDARGAVTTQAEKLDRQLIKLGKQLAEIGSTTVKTAQVVALEKQIQNLVESGALFPNKLKPATEAIQLAQAAIAKGDRQLAKIYYLSAVNHAPSDEQILQAYADLILTADDCTLDDLQRLRSVLQVSVYQIPPQHIKGMLGLLTKARETETRLVAAQQAKILRPDWKARFDEVTSTTVESICTDENKLTQRLRSLNEISEGIQTQEQPDGDLRRNVESEIGRAQDILAAGRLTRLLDKLLKDLTEAVEASPNKAISILQTAESTLGQLWGIYSVGFPAPLKAKIDGFSNSLRSAVEKLAEAKSRPLLAEVNQQLDSARQFTVGNDEPEIGKTGSLQKAVEHYEACLAKAIPAYQEMSSASLKRTAEDTLGEIRKLAADAKRQQFDKYQQWAISVCADAYWAYNGTSFKLNLTAHDNTIARELFSDSDLGLVDQSLLCPETGRLFNDVIGKLVGKMNGEGAFYTQRDMAVSKKRKFENF
jgi:hypothetical protein